MLSTDWWLGVLSGDESSQVVFNIRWQMHMITIDLWSYDLIMLHKSIIIITVVVVVVVVMIIIISMATLSCSDKMPVKLSLDNVNNIRSYR